MRECSFQHCVDVKAICERGLQQHNTEKLGFAFFFVFVLRTEILKGKGRGGENKMQSARNAYQHVLHLLARAETFTISLDC